MDQQENKKEKKPKLKFGFGISLGESSSALVIGIISGVLTAGKTIRDKFYDDVKNSTDIGEKMIEQATALSDKIFENSGQSFSEFSAAVRNQKKLNAEAIDELILKKRGVRKKLIVGTFDRAALMSRRSVNAILFNSAVGAAVGAALTLGFFNGIATRAKIDAIDDAVEPDNNQPPEQKALPFKDRDSLETQAKAASDKKEAEIKQADQIVEKVASAKEERPKSHVDKLVAEAAEQQDVALAR